jgi:hypothetical protein
MVDSAGSGVLDFVASRAGDKSKIGGDTLRRQLHSMLSRRDL